MGDIGFALSQRFAGSVDSLAGTMSTTIHPSTTPFVAHHYACYYSKPASTKNPNHTPLLIAESRPQWMCATFTEGFRLSGEALKEHWRTSMAGSEILQYAFCNKYTYAVGHF